MEEGYPRPISDFGLPPGGIDAAFSWAHNDKTYFFKDNLYWRYDDHERRMDPGYPSETILWKGIPSPLDDAMRWSDGESVRWFEKERKKALLRLHLRYSPVCGACTAKPQICRHFPCLKAAEREGGFEPELPLLTKRHCKFKQVTEISWVPNNLILLKEHS